MICYAFKILLYYSITIMNVATRIFLQIDKYFNFENYSLQAEIHWKQILAAFFITFQ